MSRRSTRIATTAVKAIPPTPAATSSPTALKAKVKKTASPEQVVEAAAVKRTKKEKVEDTDVVPVKKQRVKKEKEPEPIDDGFTRCQWASSPRYPLLQQYHDKEWCVLGGFDRTNRYLFEMLILEGAQAGLSWSTVLHKREAYREAYDNFDYNIIADTYTSPASNDRLMQTGIVKNKLKVEASMVNARLFRDLLNAEYPDQARLEDTNGFWQFLQQYKKPEMTEKEKLKRRRAKESSGEYITRSEISDRLSEDLKKRGFKFVGTTIMHAYLVAVGIETEDLRHSKACHCYSDA
ncbi:hypothetical protein BGZ83_007150 [Gryganskiella cystojenkinii]|nr:hypothetical protein BGZ83_007150 [Gryganskiella cystojenkinii]